MSERFAEIRDKLERVRIRRTDVEGALDKMDRDLRAAEHNREVAPEWAVAAAHQAIVSGCSALMAARGYRVRPNGHHKIAIQFTRSELPEHAELFDQAELIRRTRHRMMYGTRYTVTDDEVGSTLGLAHTLAAILKESSLKILKRAETARRSGRQTRG